MGWRQKIFGNGLALSDIKEVLRRFRDKIRRGVYPDKSLSTPPSPRAAEPERPPRRTVCMCFAIGC
jgi:hypothetical protein